MHTYTRTGQAGGGDGQGNGNGLATQRNGRGSEYATEYAQWTKRAGSGRGNSGALTGCS